MSTNVSESGVTLPNIKYVIDTLRCKSRFFCATTQCSRLRTIFISKQSADQRASRAGRLQNGECFRLCTKEDYTKSLSALPVSEFLKSDLSYFYFYCKTIGINNVCDVDLLTVYDRNRLEHAVQFLISLQLIDYQGQLTRLGRVVSAIPLDIRLALVLIKSFENKFTCSKEMIIIGISIISSLHVVFFENLHVQEFFFYYTNQETIRV